MHKTLLLLLAFGLASCADAPENLFAPVAQTAPGASRVDMLVATTANEVGALETSVENVETASVGSAAPK